MPQHVDVNRERHLGSLPSTFDHPSDTHATKGLPALAGEHISRLGILLTMQPLEASKLVAFQIMDAIDAALEPADRNGALG